MEAIPAELENHIQSLPRTSADFLVAGDFGKVFRPPPPDSFQPVFKLQFQVVLFFPENSGKVEMRAAQGKKRSRVTHPVRFEFLQSLDQF